ncbi:MAG: retention module-containing protein [Motiliproteus sp.]
MISILGSKGDVVVLNREFVPEQGVSSPQADLAIPPSLLQGGEIFLTGANGALMLAQAGGQITVGPDCVVCIPEPNSGDEVIVTPVAETDLDTDIEALQAAIAAGVDPTEEFAPAGAGAGGSGNNGFVELARVGEQLLVEAGYDTQATFGALQRVAVVDVGTQQGTGEIEVVSALSDGALQPANALLSISGPGTVVEGETTDSYTVSVNQQATDVTTPITVQLSYSGTAADGSDYTGVTEVTIPAGSNSATFSIDTLDDALLEGSESFTVTLGTISGGNFEAIAADGDANSVETTITDGTGSDGDPGTEDTALLSITGPGTVVEGETTDSYTVSVNQLATDVTTPITVQLSYSGTAADGSDFTGVTEVTIPAGSNSATFSIDTLDDALLEGSESFTVTLGTISGGNFEAIAADGDANSVETTITDGTGSDGDPGTEDTALLSITGPGSVVEGETTSNYTVSVNQLATDVTTPITVQLSYSGTAADGSDFTGVTEVTIPAGSNSATFSIDTLDDALLEGSESFTVTLGTISGGNFEAIAADGDANSVETTITDGTGSDGDPGTEDTALLSITGPGTVVEGETTDSYTVSVNQLATDVTTPITVQLSYSGTAADGSDFTGVTEVTIPAGSNSATFSIDTLDDALLEGSESFTVTLGTISGGNFEAIAADGDANSVETTITDGTGSDGDPGTEDTALLSISGPGTVVEGETTGTYTVSVNQLATDVTTPITVQLSYSGTAADGSDFTGVTEVTIPAGSNSATFSIDTLDDALLEGSESFTVTLGTISGGNFEAIAADGDANSVETTITDGTGSDGDPGTEDTALLSITGPGSVVEGETTSNYTVSVNQLATDVTTPITVQLSYSGTAADGSDFTGVTEVTIPAGSNSASFTLATLADGLNEADEVFTVTLGAISDSNFEAIAVKSDAGSVETTIIDADLPKVNADLDSYQVIEGQVLASSISAQNSLLDNDGDAGLALSVIGVATDAAGSGAVIVDGSNELTTELGGTVTVNADGSFSYTAPIVDHDKDRDGGVDDQVIDSFYYRASDGSDASGWTRVEIDVLDTAPEAQIDTAQLTEVGGQQVASGNLLDNDSNSDGGRSLTSVTYQGQTQNFDGAETLVFGQEHGLNGKLTVDSDGGYRYVDAETIVIDSDNYADNDYDISLHGFTQNDDFNITANLANGQPAATESALVAIANGAKSGIGVKRNGGGQNAPTIDQDDLLLFDLGSERGLLTFSVAQANAQQGGVDPLWAVYDSDGVFIESGNLSDLEPSQNGDIDTYRLETESGESYQYVILTHTEQNQGFVVNQMIVDGDSTGFDAESFGYQVSDLDGDSDLSHLIIGDELQIQLATVGDDEITGVDGQAELFVWQQGDNGEDTLIGFDASEDVLHLGDLLQGEDASVATLDQYLDFGENAEGEAQLLIKPEGADQATASQTITFKDTSLEQFQINIGADGSSDAQLISKLLEDNALLTD